MEQIETIGNEVLVTIAKRENLVSKILGQVNKVNKAKNIAGLVRKTVRNTARNAVLLTVAAVAAIGATKGLAKTYNVDPYLDNDPYLSTVEEINQIIEDANNGMIDPNNSKLRDTINFEDGTYQLHALGPNQFEIFDFLPNRNYTFGVATISGSGLEHLGLIRIAHGGNMDISAEDLTLQKSIVGIAIQDVPYDNINISGVNFEVNTKGDIKGKAIAMENRQHQAPLTKAAVEVSYCTADGGAKFVMYAEGPGPTENSPYASVKSCTLKNLTSSGGVIDVPIFYKEKSEGEWTVLGNDEIKDNVLINCSSLSKPADFWIYHSPEHIAQKDVGESLITGKTYYDWERLGGNPHIFNGENCFIADANHFLPDSITPKRDSPMNLGNGNYIGAIKPYHELDGNLNFDEYVDFYDFAVAAKRYNGNLDEIVDITNDWLAIEPNDPNGNPK